MGTITESVDVDVDLRTAYNQWTQFETFPQFMEGVEDVQQITDTKLHWVTKVGPVVREFDAVITEQHPDELVAWHSINGPQHAGRVTFRKLDNDSTEVTAEMSIDPEGFVENVGDKTGVIDARVAGDLQRFKSFIENRGHETGAWRGTVGESAGGAMGTAAGDVAGSAPADAAPPLGGYAETTAVDEDGVVLADDLDQTGLAHGDDALPTRDDLPVNDGSLAAGDDDQPVGDDDLPVGDDALRPSDDLDPESPLPLAEAVPSFDDVAVDAERASLDEERRPYTE